MKPSFPPQLKYLSLICFASGLSVIAPSQAIAGNLEFGVGSYPSPPNGPTTADQTATFLENTTEPNVFGAYTPTITLKASISNQQYANGLVFGDTIAAPTATFRPMNVIATPANNMFTANPTGILGTQVSIVNNYAFEFFTNVDNLIGQPLNGKFYYADLTLTFSRPVTDPVIHMTGMGGSYVAGTAHGHSAEFEFITPGIAASKLSGSPTLNVGLNGSGNYDITNSATTLGATCPAVGGSSTSGGACGSVKFTGTNITQLKFKVYVRGDANGTAWSAAGTHAGDVFLFGGASYAKPVTISGTVFNDANGLTDNAINGTGTNAGGVFANLIDQNGKVVASVPVAANGTYSFLAIGAGQYTVSLSTIAGVQGTTAPAINVPSGWNKIGEGTAAAGDGTIDGSTAITVGSANLTGVNFGLEELPIVPGFVNGTCQADGLVWVSGGDVANNKINQIGSYRISNSTFTNVVTTAKDWGDIAWATDNKLYGVEYTDISGSANPSGLYRIDPTTGQTTFITDLSMLGKVANSLTGIPNGGLLMGGDFYSKVYRYELSNATNPPALWHDFGAGFPAGDFIPFNGKVYIAWNTGSSFQLYEVTVDANYNYVSHRDLGALPDGSRGLGLVMNKIYTVAGTNIHQINSIPTSPVTTIATTIVPNMPAPYFMGGASGTEEPFGGCSQASDPNVLLVKRITGINGGTNTVMGDDLATYIDQLSNPYDDNTITIPNKTLPSDPPKDTDKWPDPITFLIGGTNGGNIKPGDEMEYTIYFLSAGAGEAKNVLFCDRVPTNVSFIPTAFNSSTPATGGLGADRGILSQINGTTSSYTNIADGDTARYFVPGIDPTSIYPNIKCGGANTNGAVVVNLGNLPKAITPGTPAGAFGFVRFKGRVK